jgi:hypothetical protein
MTISTESSTAAAGQARQVTKKSVDAFKNVTRSATYQLNTFKLPAVDLTQPVARYFEYLQKAIDLNRDLATQVGRTGHQLPSVSRLSKSAAS